MTGPREDLTHALHRLRVAVRERTAPPAPAALRARATRALRVRRTATALAAAAVVAAVTIGGAEVLQRTATPTAPPADAPAPTRSAEPTGPTPSPRPALLPPRTPDGTFADVDWWHATMTLPPHDQCPSGEVTFEPFRRSAFDTPRPAAQAQGRIIQYFIGEEQEWAGGDVPGGITHGDLTGDGRSEVVIWIGCDADGVLDGAGEGRAQLLAIARDDDGNLTGLGYAGPAGAAYLSWWIEDGTLLVDADPYAVSPEDHFPAVPGVNLAYRWDGQQFVAVGPPAPIVPVDPDLAGPPVSPGAVASGLGCPAVSLRFRRDDPDWGGTAVAAGTTFVIPARPHQQFLFDLDNTGTRLLVTALSCTDPAGTTRTGLAVFAPAGAGWQGISVLRHPDGAEPLSWADDGDSRLRVEWSGAGGAQPVTYRWNGTIFESPDE